MSQNIQVKTAVILASGYGRRMCRKEYSPSKPMTLVAQKPLISYIIDLLIWGGIEKIYVVYHAVTSDVLKLLDYSNDYAKYLEFIEQDEQKGTLLTFSRVKGIISTPFLMVFEDIIADKNDFLNMLNIGRKYITSDADLVIQTVSNPSVFSEEAFVVEENRVIKYQKNGIIGETKGIQKKKYGGMVYLWLSNPFSDINENLQNQNYKFSIFLENYIPDHLVYEMPIHDMWDIDTPESVLCTEEIFRNRGGWNGCVK